MRNAISKAGAALIRGLGLMVFFSALAICQSYVPQIADGGPWQTTLVLTNTTTSPISANLTFYQETSGGATQSWNLAFVEGPAQTVSVPAGSTMFLHTLGTSPETSVGWGQVAATAGVVAYAIFTQRVPGRTDQDGTAPGAAGAERILVPFDNTGGSVTGVALVNPLGSSETVAVNIKTDNGAISQGSISLPAQGHLSFALPQQLGATGGHSGLAEFYAARGSLSVIALRFNATGAFTTAPVYLQSGAPVIGSSPPVSGGPTR